MNDSSSASGISSNNSLMAAVTSTGNVARAFESLAKVKKEGGREGGREGRREAVKEDALDHTHVPFLPLSLTHIYTDLRFGLWHVPLQAG